MDGLALAIGNSRLHWGWFHHRSLAATWDTPHLSDSVAERLMAGGFAPDLWPPGIEGLPSLANHPELYIASPVKSQLQLWQQYQYAKVITTREVPLAGTYPTLGVDRALALLGAGNRWGWPVLVVDAGTALTFTGGDASGRLVGGAIVPGLGLQLRSLREKTAALPLVELPEPKAGVAFPLPQRWARDTPGAIHSGVIYTVLAGLRDFIQAWWQQFPHSRVVFTGGDRQALWAYLQAQSPEMAVLAHLDPHLIFWGLSLVMGQLTIDN
ncbi:MAG TPA: pantothenate kinase [Oscillatoriaceae cyanobacterium M33_DOE_052]|uniref:Type III pantothenate kinase n=1 Tax=Planktothricoides sp. SpSt-374 TaxID=2282167 RepID=A0A7C3VFF8_9CYAN|nr:pantothenate kinase [Oscillatoriaceae cyanobacterium M33_DOE_052]